LVDSIRPRAAGRGFHADCASLMAVCGSTRHVNGLRVEAADFVSVAVLLEEESLAVAAVVALGLAVGEGIGVIVGAAVSGVASTIAGTAAIG